MGMAGVVVLGIGLCTAGLLLGEKGSLVLEREKGKPEGGESGYC